ncbi:HIRAN domain-containing protein [Fusobacterium nucleatum]|uniref:HIRAN domain-containing protein n=1 Tax=Fusobacterium nucleatum TaxID=851 RepID=UPI0030CED8DB
MLKKILRYLFLIMTVFSGILTIVAFSDSIIFGIFMLVVTFIFFFFFSLFGTKNITPKPQNNEVQKGNVEEHGTLQFEVAGTFVEARQKIIKNFVKNEIKEGMKAYDGLTTKEIKTQRYENIEIYEVSEDEKWDKDYFRLEKEPDNEYDKNAIKVILNDFSKIGYIPKEKTLQVGKLIDDNKILSMYFSITGGKYKLWDGEDLETDEEEYSITLTINY